MKFNENDEYYIVKGWFEKTNGMHDGTFYGAVVSPGETLQPRRVAIPGSAAESASKIAAEQPAVVYQQELFESDAGGLNPKERGETASMLLDREAPTLYVHIPTGDQATKLQDEHTGKWAWRVLKPHYAAGFEKAWVVAGDQNDENYQPTDLATESVSSTGAIAIMPAALASPNNTSRLGMPDRGGHGRVDNLGPKKVRTKRNMVKSKAKAKDTSKGQLKGIGNSTTMQTISQSGGRRGG